VRLPNIRWWICHIRTVLEKIRKIFPTCFSSGIHQIDEGTQKNG
jgi:hypothetical protein